jgi:hypothetical protein
MRWQVRREKKWVALLTLILVLGLLIPFQTEVVPPWEVRFVDNNGLPVSGVHAEEACHHYSYTEHDICADYPDSRQASDENGLVRFASKSIRLSPISRLVRSIFFYFTLFAHGSVGIDAYLIVSVPMDYKSIELVRYIPGQSPPSTIVLERH